MQYQNVLESLGMAKNEARIYETLVRENESSVGYISEKSGVHRRNVYDSLNRLMEKGLVFEIVDSKENKYQAVEPRKLQEILNEKVEKLDSILPGLESLYVTTPAEYRVHTYRGKEGWKQYMKDILRTSETFYSIGAQGAWLDERVQAFAPAFLAQLKSKDIKMLHLFDYEVKESNHSILKYVGENYKFLPKKYATTSGVDVFGDRVNIMHQQHLGQVGESSEIMFTVIQNKNLADSFRTWFQFMWDFCPDK